MDGGALLQPLIGLDNLAQVLGISSRPFQQTLPSTFVLSPYAYFVLMRIHKAKERLAGDFAAEVRFASPNSD